MCTSGMWFIIQLVLYHELNLSPSLESLQGRNHWLSVSLTVFSRKAKHTQQAQIHIREGGGKERGVCVREIERWVGERERAIRFEIQEAHSGIQRVSRRLPCIICFSCETMRFEPKWKLGSCMRYRSHYVDKAYWTWQVTGWNIEKMKLSLKQYSKIKKNRDRRHL